jgi:hypothetical protein
MVPEPANEGKNWAAKRKLRKQIVLFEKKKQEQGLGCCEMTQESSPSCTPVTAGGGGSRDKSTMAAFVASTAKSEPENVGIGTSQLDQQQVDQSAQLFPLNNPIPIRKSSRSSRSLRQRPKTWEQSPTTAMDVRCHNNTRLRAGPYQALSNNNSPPPLRLPPGTQHTTTTYTSIPEQQQAHGYTDHTAAVQAKAKVEID